MTKGALPSLKNPVLAALYRRIQRLEEGLPRVPLARPAGDVPPRAAGASRRCASALCSVEDERSSPPRPAGPFEIRLPQHPRAVARS